MRYSIFVVPIGQILFSCASRIGGKAVESLKLTYNLHAELGVGMQTR